MSSDLAALFRPASEYGPGGVKISEAVQLKEAERDQAERARAAPPEWAQEEEVHKRLVEDLAKIAACSPSEPEPELAPSRPPVWAQQPQASSSSVTRGPYTPSVDPPPPLTGHSDRGAQPTSRTWSPGAAEAWAHATDPHALLAFTSSMLPTAEEIIYRASIDDTLSEFGLTGGSRQDVRDAKSFHSQL